MHIKSLKDMGDLRLKCIKNPLFFLIVVMVSDLCRGSGSNCPEKCISV